MDFNKFSQEEKNSFNDVLFNALDLFDLSNEQLKKYWDILDSDIKLDINRWGVGDTVNRDNMYVFFRSKFIKNN